jgi:hypothetical protein
MSFRKDSFSPRAPEHSHSRSRMGSPARTPSMRDFSQDLQTWSKVNAEPERQPDQRQTRAERPRVPSPTPSPPRYQVRAPNYITLGIFRIRPTATSISLLLFALKKLSAMTAALFWATTAKCLIRFLLRRFLSRIPYEVISGYLSGDSAATTLWRCIFPRADGDVYHLRLAIHRSDYRYSPLIYSISTPLDLGSMVAWLSLMTFLFISHHLLCFVQDCLTQLEQQLGRQNDT